MWPPTTLSPATPKKNRHIYVPPSVCVCVCVCVCVSPSLLFLRSFLQPLFFALFLFRGSHRVCVCVYVYFHIFICGIWDSLATLISSISVHTSVQRHSTAAPQHEVLPLAL